MGSRTIRHYLVLGLRLTGFLVALLSQVEVSHAQQQELGPYRRPPGAGDDGESTGRRSTALSAGDYVHDGFYMRLAGGFGGASHKLVGTARDSEGAAGRLRGSAGGVAGATEVAVGFTPIRGWVFGAVIDTVTIAGSSGRLSRDFASFDFDTSQLAIYGLLLDWYPNPLRGFHAQVTGGLASFVMAQGNSAGAFESGKVIAPPHVAVGGGFTLGVGNQWWLSPNWTIGLLPRLALGWASGVDQYGAGFNHRVLGYQLLVTTTYH